jgi:AraC family transcriptional regulator, regulatory protein of adaptative response / DNA-3-methyladenine glycosylase II
MQFGFRVKRELFRVRERRFAFASGFSSLRRFNDAFGTQYRMPPTHLRKRAAEHHETVDRFLGRSPSGRFDRARITRDGVLLCH